MPQEHQRARSLANRQPSVIQSAQAPSVDGWFTVCAYDSTAKLHKEGFRNGNVTQSVASRPSDSRIPKALSSALSPPRDNASNRLDTADFSSKITRLKSISSRTTNSKTTRLKRRPGNVEAISNAFVKKNSDLNTSSNRHGKQSSFARQHEDVNSPSEPDKYLKRHQVGLSGSPGREYHPDLEQPPRESCVTHRHAKACPRAAGIPLARSITTNADPFSKSWPAPRSQNDIATLDYRGELRDSVLEETHQLVEREFDRGFYIGLPRSQSRHSICPNERDTRLHKPPLIETDRHHTELTNKNDNLEPATAVICDVKEDVQAKVIAGHRYGSDCIGSGDDDDGDDDDRDDDEEDTDDDEQVGFREFQQQATHPRIAPYAGHAYRTREPEYNSSIRLPDPWRWNPRRRRSCPGVFWHITVRERWKTV